MVDPYVTSYLLIGFAIFILGKKMIKRAGEDEPVTAFILCLLLWPVLVLYQVTDAWQRRRKRR